MDYGKAQLLTKAAPVAHSRLDWLPENLVQLEQRATEKDFTDCGAMGGIVKKSDGFKVYVTYQYALGEQQHVFHNCNYSSLRLALRALYREFRKAYSQTASRKFSSLLVDGVRADEE